MPIRPENVARYPKNWKGEIVPRIRARSGNQCECMGECGLRHYVTQEGKQIDLPPALQIDALPPIRCQAVNYQPHPVTSSKVILTVGHLNHTPEDCSDENLKHWCQRCHNRYDVAERRRGIKQRRHEARAVGDLLEAAQ